MTCCCLLFGVCCLHSKSGSIECDWPGFVWMDNLEVTSRSKETLVT